MRALASLLPARLTSAFPTPSRRLVTQSLSAASLSALNAHLTGLPRHLAITITALSPSLARAQFTLAPIHAAANGHVHGGSIVSLADTACGYGCVAHLPEGAVGFATAELKANFVGTVVGDGRVVSCEARLVHKGRRTQVWDAVVEEIGGKQLALFRCTQMLMYDGEGAKKDLRGLKELLRGKE